MAEKSLIPKSKAKTAYSLLSEVRALILAEPLRYNQRSWLTRKDEFPHEDYPACGTIGCVAGWVATLKGPKRFAWGMSEDIAGRVLGLPTELQYALFNENAAGNADPQTYAHAKAGAAHIAAFQKKHRAQLLAKKL